MVKLILALHKLYDSLSQLLPHTQVPVLLESPGPRPRPAFTLKIPVPLLPSPELASAHK